ALGGQLGAAGGVAAQSEVEAVVHARSELRRGCLDERGYLGVRGRALAAVELLGDALLRARPGSRELAPCPSERAIAPAPVLVTLVPGVHLQGGAADPGRGAEL